MSTMCLQDSARSRVQVIADFQFGKGAGEALFPEGCEATLSRTGRVRQVSFCGKRLVTVRAKDGRFTLGIDGALRLLPALRPPAYRVVVLEDVAGFIRQGKNTFAKHVTAADPAIRSGDEVMVVDEKDQLLATGSAVLSGGEMLLFNYGVAVKVRQGR